MKTRKTAVAVLFAALLASPAFAAPLDISEAIRLTLADNSSLCSLRQEAVKARAFKLQADGTLLPNVYASGYLDKQREDQTSDGSRSDSRMARATLEQTIYSGGKNSALRRQAPYRKTIAEMMVADGENSAVGELYARFYNVLLQRGNIEAEEAAVKTSELHLRETRKMSELGLANRLDVIRAGQQLATDTASLASARGLFEAAEISLMNYMSIAPQDKRTAAGELAVPEVSGSRAESLARAEQFRADRRQLEAQLGYQKEQLEIEKSGLRPKASFETYAGYLDPYQKQDEGGGTWRAELSISVPVFDRNVTKSSVMAAGAKLEQDKIALRQKELDLKSEVETAWIAIETTARTLTASGKSLELAEESLRLAEVGYREGVTPQLDLLSAQASLTSARLDYLRAKYNHLIAIVALKMTEGTIVKWSGGGISK